MELLAFASRQFAPKTMDLSVRFIRSYFVQFFLVSERSGRLVLRVHVLVHSR